MDNISTIPKKFALDNAAKIYPAAMTKNWNSVYGISAHLKDKIEPYALKAAVKELSVRFPSMYVCLKKELFWDVLVPATDFDIVEKESKSPCRPMDVKSKTKPLFRIVYSDYEIRAEFFHSVTDGGGAVAYLKALLVEYFAQCGQKFSNTGDIKLVSQHPSQEEVSDDFQGVYEKGLHCSRADSNAFQIKYKTEPDFLSTTKILMPVDKIKAVAKNVYGCTVTQYLAAIYAMALLSKYNGKRKPVKLSIPVNLRPYYDSQTLRNFSSYITIDVTPKDDITFENVLAMIKEGMKEKITKENFTKAVSQNIADEIMPISKYSPNFLKRIVMRQAFKLYGERKYTSTITSIGIVKLPDEISEKINYFSATLGETYLNKINSTVLTFGNTLCINISSTSKDMGVQNSFVNLIKEHGIDVLNSLTLKSANA